MAPTHLFIKLGSWCQSISTKTCTPSFLYNFLAVILRGRDNIWPGLPWELDHSPGDRTCMVWGVHTLNACFGGQLPYSLTQTGQD